MKYRAVNDARKNHYAFYTNTKLIGVERYKIKCKGLDGATITVREGRTVGFGGSLKSVLHEIAGSIS